MKKSTKKALVIAGVTVTLGAGGFIGYTLIKNKRIRAEQLRLFTTDNDIIRALKDVEDAEVYKKFSTVYQERLSDLSNANSNRKFEEAGEKLDDLLDEIEDYLDTREKELKELYEFDENADNKTATQRLRVANFIYETFDNHEPSDVIKSIIKKGSKCPDDINNYVTEKDYNSIGDVIFDTLVHEYEIDPEFIRQNKIVQLLIKLYLNHSIKTEKEVKEVLKKFDDEISEEEEAAATDDKAKDFDEEEEVRKNKKKKDKKKKNKKNKKKKIAKEECENDNEYDNREENNEEENEVKEEIYEEDVNEEEVTATDDEDKEETNDEISEEEKVEEENEERECQNEVSNTTDEENENDEGSEEGLIKDICGVKVDFTADSDEDDEESEYVEKENLKDLLSKSVVEDEEDEDDNVKKNEKSVEKEEKEEEIVERPTKEDFEEYPRMAYFDMIKYRKDILNSTTYNIKERFAHFNDSIHILNTKEHYGYYHECLEVIFNILAMDEPEEHTLTRLDAFFKEFDKLVKPVIEKRIKDITTIAR